MDDNSWVIFQTIPEDLDETWVNVALLGGITEGAYDMFTLANNFKRAGDILIEQVLDSVPIDRLIYPILYNYRHSLELYLKAIVKSTKRIHKLSELLLALEKLLKDYHNTTIPLWFKSLIQEFDKYDPNSTAFRYPEVGISKTEEVIVDLPRLKQIMDILAQTFQRILFAEERRN